MHGFSLKTAVDPLKFAHRHRFPLNSTFQIVTIFAVLFFEIYQRDLLIMKRSTSQSRVDAKSAIKQADHAGVIDQGCNESPCHRDADDWGSRMRDLTVLIPTWKMNARIKRNGQQTLQFFSRLHDAREFLLLIQDLSFSQKTGKGAK
jgi:hypothetical protein